MRCCLSPCWALWWAVCHGCRSSALHMAPPLSKPGSGQASKRRYPELVTKVKDIEPETFTRFFVIHSEDEERPVGKMSPFVVAKVLENLIGYNYKAKKDALQ